MRKQIVAITFLAVGVLLLLMKSQQIQKNDLTDQQKLKKESVFNREYSESYEQASRVLTFDQFRSIYNKKYENEHELIYRKQIFMQNQIKISAHNKLYQLGQTQYFMGHNIFSDLTSEEFLSLYTWKKSRTPLNVDNGLTATSQCKGAIMDTPNPPNQKDWGDKVNQMKDQGQCGKDWAMVAASTVQSLFALKNGKLPLLSVQQLLQCSFDYGNEGCFGGFMDQAFWYIIDSGIATEAQYPDRQVVNCKYVPNMKYTGFTQCARIPSGNYSKLVSAIVQSPVSIALNYSPDMMLYKGGIYDGNCTYQLNHAMVLTGYGGKSPSFYWRLRNTVSKSSRYGMNGYIHIIRDGRDGPGKCGLQLWPSVPQNLN